MMNLSYPDRHHPCYFLEDALIAQGVNARFIRNADSLNCWGLDIDGRIMVWLIDNRWPYEREHEDPAAAELLRRGALVCCAQYPDAERVGAKWLPLAVTPGYRPIPQEKLYDVAFVGYVRDEARARLLADIGAKFSVYHLSGVFGDEAVRAYCSARVGVNIPTRYGNPNAYDSWNMRAPEIMATGAALVTPFQGYLKELGLEETIHYAGYRNELHPQRYLEDTIGYALQYSDRIGESGRQLVEERHTYAHRAQQVMEWLNDDTTNA